MACHQGLKAENGLMAVVERAVLEMTVIRRLAARPLDTASACWRAVNQDRKMAAASGINVRRVDLAFCRA
jgi:hypothetical protein